MLFVELNILVVVLPFPLLVNGFVFVVVLLEKILLVVLVLLVRLLKGEDEA